MSDWRSDANPHVFVPRQPLVTPPPGCTPGHPRPESRPFDWPLYLDRECWVEFANEADDWHGQRVLGPWKTSDGRVVGLTLEPVPYHDANSGGWCMTEVDGCGEFTVGFVDISSIRLLTDEEKRPPFCIRDSRIANDGHLGGPDDSHYAKLGDPQPIVATEAWSRTWPSEIAYHLSEATHMVARCGTRGQMERDLRKAAWLILRAADMVRGRD